MEPATATLIAAAINAAATVGSGVLANQGAGKETKIQRKQRKLIDQLINGLQSGEGPYASLFANDEAAFQKSFVEPAKSLYKNQIAPQIQQSYLQGGQQRGTAIEDQLLRAGVDLDQMLNQQYMNFQNSGKDRMQSVIQSILGGGAGAPAGLSTGQAAAQGGTAFLGSDAFGNTIKDLFKTPATQATPAAPPGQSPQGYANTRKTFEPNWRDVQFA